MTEETYELITNGSFIRNERPLVACDDRIEAGTYMVSKRHRNVVVIDYPHIGSNRVAVIFRSKVLEYFEKI